MGEKGLKEEVKRRRYKLSTQNHVHRFLKRCYLKIHIRYICLFFSHGKGDGLDINICHIEGERPFLLLWKVRQSRHCTYFLKSYFLY